VSKVSLNGNDMKIDSLTPSLILGILGVGLVLAPSAQSQPTCPAPTNLREARESSCAEIYSATPERVRLNLGGRDLPVDTSSAEKIGTFANFAPTQTLLRKDPSDPRAFNVLTTANYARADVQLSDGSLVWTKPYSQIALASGNSCGVGNLYESLPGQPSPILCLRSGSILVVTPSNQSQVSVVTDEGMVFTPGTIYLVNRNAAQKRTDVFVFSGGGAVQMLVNNNTACASPSQTMPGMTVNALGKECRFRIDAGQYVSVTSQDLSLPKSFDLPAWVATDPFFAPLRANTGLQLASSSPQTADAFPPSTASSAIAAVQTPLAESVISQETNCLVMAAEDPFGGASAEANFLNPPVLPPKPAPVIPPPMPQPKTIRGMW
jgi:hypothetical protein